MLFLVLVNSDLEERCYCHTNILIWTTIIETFLDSDRKQNLFLKFIEVKLHGSLYFLFPEL